MGLLDGTRAVITGGASGIGAATARRFAEEGARVAVVDRNGELAEKVAAEVDGRAYEVDVTDFAALDAAVADADRAFGGITAIFNNAGIGNSMSLHEYPLEEWQRIIDICLNGVFHGFKAAAPRILAAGGGSIVSTSSISGTRPAAGEGPYSAAKAAVAAITATAAMEYAPTIRVNAVAPGMIETPLTHLMLAEDGLAMRERQIAKTPLARIGEPGDIADVVVFLCSPLARFVTGQNIVIDGGMTLHGSGVDGMLDHIHTLMGRK